MTMHLRPKTWNNRTYMQLCYDGKLVGRSREVVLTLPRDIFQECACAGMDDQHMCLVMFGRRREPEPGTGMVMWHGRWAYMVCPKKERYNLPTNHPNHQRYYIDDVIDTARRFYDEAMNELPPKQRTKLNMRKLRRALRRGEEFPIPEGQATEATLEWAKRVVKARAMREKLSVAYLAWENEGYNNLRRYFDRRDRQKCKLGPRRRASKRAIS